MSDIGRGNPEKWVVNERGGEEAERKRAKRSSDAFGLFLDLFQVLLPRCSGSVVPETELVGSLNMCGSEGEQYLNGTGAAPTPQSRRTFRTATYAY